MATLATMYPLVVGNRAVKLASAYVAGTDTTISVSQIDTSAIPAAPNRVTIIDRVSDTEEYLITVSYTNISGTTLAGVSVVEYDVAASATHIYPIGSPIFRPLTKSDIDAITNNINTLGYAVSHINGTNFGLQPATEVGKVWGITTGGTTSLIDGAGTTDYTELTNKPKINSVELIGNKSPNDLSIVDLNTNQTITNKVIDVDNNTVSNIEGDNFKLQATTDANKVWGIKPDGTTGLINRDNVEWGDIAGTLTNQTDLQSALNSKLNSNLGTTRANKMLRTSDTGEVTVADLPVSLEWGNITGTLNNQTDLSAELTSKFPKQVGVAEAGKLLNVGTDGNASTTAIDDIGSSTLVTTAKTIIAAINENRNTIDALSGTVKVQVVTTMPTTGIPNTMYYVLRSGTTNVYDIYLYTEDASHVGTFTPMGTSEVDLTQFVKKIDIVDNLTSDDTDKPLSAKQGKTLNSTKQNKVYYQASQPVGAVPGDLWVTDGVEGGLPAATTAGTIAVYNGTAWVAQTGYGYVDGTTVVKISKDLLPDFQSKIYYGNTEPTGAVEGDFWVDTTA